MREETFDNNFISYFSRNQGPYKFDPNWTVRIDAHFMGGGQHYERWEAADIGLMVIFRKNGKILRSKMAFLQSKKLYGDNVQLPKPDPYDRNGMGKLLVTNSEHINLTRTKTIRFEESSQYQALKKDNEQQQVMHSFQKKFAINMYYLFYNPMVIPHSIESPLTTEILLPNNEVGCRVVKKDLLDDALKSYPKNHAPSYGELKYLLEKEHIEEVHTAGWRLEYFVVDLFMACKEGLKDDSPNFATLYELLSYKSRPISAALSITVDLTE